MSRLSPLSNPLLLGFEELERFLDRAGKGGSDGYPPYNIERLLDENERSEKLRITLAVAGFRSEQLSVAVENNRLTIRGRQDEEDGNDYLHRGIAARQFQRTFVLAHGLEITDAALKDGLLCINLVRPQPNEEIRQIAIKDLG